ncbi:UNVERIFIED_ORG: nucleoside-diphosphate-sugar epimerase [Pseudomonas fluorescens]|jgi:nucleoside-diphosphate-sugar epimerase|uniref:UDP-glucose 4-epimerase family protein n=1 Tax=Pseudomonas TaxID=286 RepID=UPI000A1E88EC|nr:MULTISPECIES: SDR family oxidoreductase [unclassified Pseudomonas]MDP9712905.1 nucleoside-diphosphate-sugar epimerase [Pseudomonas fluorescens]
MIGTQVLVTGATGFVGEALVFRLLRDKVFSPVAAVRGETRLSGLCRVVAFDMGDRALLPPLAGIDVVVHCAARVHVMNDLAEGALERFRKINVEGTVRLARSAAEAGVKRFIFVSSIKVNGEMTLPGVVFKADDLPAPLDPYGLSKREAEDALRAISVETGMEVVVIRPPLVYGPGVGANFLSMMRWLERGTPLPLGAIHNHRSLVALENLVDLLNVCISHPEAAGNTFLVSDGEDLSTTQLLRRMASALGVKPRLLSIPSWVLKTGASLIGRADLAQRLCGSLQVDISKTIDRLGWSPVIGVDDALKRTAYQYQSRQRT